jgi:hypothetical protein
MPELIALYLVLLLLLVGSVLFVQAVRHRTDLLSIRNFFVLGVCFFQLISAAAALWFQQYGVFGLNNPAQGAFIFAIVITLFLPVMFLAYRRGWVVRRLARHVPVKEAPAGAITMISLAISFLVLGAVLRLGLSSMPFASVVARIVSTGLLAVAAGMAVWAWVPRLWNPAVALLSAPIVLIAIGVASYGSFSRRDMLNIVLACGWSAYHSHWKYLGVRRSLLRLVTVGILGMLLMAPFSATRGEEGKGRSPLQVIADISDAGIGTGFASLVSTQDAGSLSMWICETRPDVFPYDTLHQAKFLGGMWIPRAFWPGKPRGLGRVMVEQRRLEGHSDEFTVGSGLVGHIVNDNPWLSLIPYAVVLGLLLRFTDELVALHSSNPFLVLPAGVALAEWFAVPRGEAAVFMFLAFLSTAGAWAGMAACAWVLSRLGLAPPLPAAAYDEFDEDEAGEEPPDPETEQSYGTLGASAGH